MAWQFRDKSSLSLILLYSQAMRVVTFNGPTAVLWSYSNNVLYFICNENRTSIHERVTTSDKKLTFELRDSYTRS